MSVDRKFEVINPSSLDKLTRKSIEVGSLGLISPLGVTPVPLVDGELVQMVQGKLVRATDATKPSFFALEDRGDLGVQVSRKLSIIAGGGNFWANTVLFDPTLTTEGVALKLGTVTIEGVARAALIAQGGSGLILGYVAKPAAINSGKLQVLITFN
jgi:hypothetical protein